MKRRCDWAADGGTLYRKYHDVEWGVPVHHDRKLFEFLILEGAQAGLSWSTILNKRAHYRKVYGNFDARKIARFNNAKVRRLLKDPGIVRNRLKIRASILNARAFLRVQKEFGSKESDAMSKDLKKRGFKFVGSTICYAFMQAVGMVNDHTVDCFRYRKLAGRRRG